jgi:hypothetical protein
MKARVQAALALLVILTVAAVCFTVWLREYNKIVEETRLVNEATEKSRSELRALRPKAGDCETVGQTKPCPCWIMDGSERKEWPAQYVCQSNHKWVCEGCPARH